MKWSNSIGYNDYCMYEYLTEIWTLLSLNKEADFFPTHFLCVRSVKCHLKLNLHYTDNMRGYLCFHLWKASACTNRIKTMARPTAAYIDTVAVIPYEIIPFLLLKCFKREYTSVISEWQLSNANSKLHCVFNIVISRVI